MTTLNIYLKCNQTTSIWRRQSSMVAHTFHYVPDSLVFLHHWWCGGSRASQNPALAATCHRQCNLKTGTLNTPEKNMKIQSLYNLFWNGINCLSHLTWMLQPCCWIRVHDRLKWSSYVYCVVHCGPGESPMGNITTPAFTRDSMSTRHLSLTCVFSSNDPFRWILPFFHVFYKKLQVWGFCI